MPHTPKKKPPFIPIPYPKGAPPAPPSKTPPTHKFRAGGKSGEATVGPGNSLSYRETTPGRKNIHAGAEAGMPPRAPKPKPKPKTKPVIGKGNFRLLVEANGKKKKST